LRQNESDRPFAEKSMLTKSTETSPIPWRIAITDMLGIALLWCLSLFLVKPVGNFPLNDDWSYGLTVKHFIQTGDFRPPGTVAAPVLTNVLWGSLFSIPAGFSFTALRLSTLTLSLLGILGVYLLIRDLSQPRWLAVIAALTLGFNPLYYALSNTFMTDVPYTAITIFAVIFFARSLRNDSNLDLIIGTALAIAATLSRQLAISVPLAFALSLILTRGFTKRNILRAPIPLLLCIGSLIVFGHWLAESGRLPATYYDRWERLHHAVSNPKVLTLSLTKNMFVGLLYLGLFLLPILIFAVAGTWRFHRRQVIALFSVTIGILALGCGVFALHGLRPAVSSAGTYSKTYLMPLSGNVLTTSGIGPLTLPDNWLGILYVPVVPALPMRFWLVITAMSVLGAGFLITCLVVFGINLLARQRSGNKLSENEGVGLFLLISAVVYLVPLFLTDFMDRYLIPSIPLLATGIGCLLEPFLRFRLANTRILRFLAMALLVAFSFFSVGATRDYLEWNRVRWEALHDLVENNRVDPGEIDGGFEFNGWYMYDPRYTYDPQKSWWWVQGNTYQICFGTRPGYKAVREYAYQNWLPPHIGKVVVLQKAQ
jgi:hypothetical protein